MKQYVLTFLALPLLLLAACTGTNTTTNDTGSRHSALSEGNEQYSESGGNEGTSEDKAKDQKMIKEKSGEEGAMKDESHIKGVVMVHGKVMTIWDGNVTETMEKDMHLKSGMTVMMNGSVKTAEGQTIQLHDGEAVMMDGTVKKVTDLHLKMMNTNGGTAQEGVMKKEGSTQGVMKAGEYKDETAAILSASVLTDGKTKVLFFHASWCPICKAANQTLTSWYTDGNGLLTTYKIDYDKEKMLKKKYGVTYQHTFVKIDGKGNVIKSITGPSDDVLKDLLKS